MTADATHITQYVNVYNAGAFLVASMAINFAILTVHLARRGRPILGASATWAGYIAAATLFIFVFVVITNGILELWVPPRWWWQPTFAAHIPSLSWTLYRAHAKLVLPAAAASDLLAETRQPPGDA
jgi:MFS-type transporter involved in bile tolerance (Atg22 family)